MIRRPSPRSLFKVIDDCDAFKRVEFLRRLRRSDVVLPIKYGPVLARGPGQAGEEPEPAADMGVPRQSRLRRRKKNGKI